MTSVAETMPACDLRCARVADLLPDDAAYESAYSRLPTWRRRKCDALRFLPDRRRLIRDSAFASAFPLADKFPPGWCFRDLHFPDGYLGCAV